MDRKGYSHLEPCINGAEYEYQPQLSGSVIASQIDVEILQSSRKMQSYWQLLQNAYESTLCQITYKSTSSSFHSSAGENDIWWSGKIFIIAQIRT